MGHQRTLTLALALTGGFLLVEALGAWFTGSLALLADAGHMLTDVGALALSVFAARMATRPATHARTYGYRRVEVLAAAANGATLVLIAGLVAWHAFGRFADPVEVEGLGLAVVALAGLAVNLVVMRMLEHGRHGNLNMRGAYLHVLGDLLGSVGAVLAGAVILLTGWTQADAIAALVTSALIVVGALRLLRESIDVLLEATPRGLDVGEVEQAITAIPGVQCVHDVHIWTVGSGFPAMSGHVSIHEGADYRRVLVAAQQVVHDRFGIAHATLQLETPEIEAMLPVQHMEPNPACLDGHVRAEAEHAHPH